MNLTYSCEQNVKNHGTDFEDRVRRSTVKKHLVRGIKVSFETSRITDSGYMGSLLYLFNEWK
jgi:hypothetical protein